MRVNGVLEKRGREGGKSVNPYIRKPVDYLWEIGVNRVFTAVTQPLEVGQPGVRRRVTRGSLTKVIG